VILGRSGAGRGTATVWSSRSATTPSSSASPAAPVASQQRQAWPGSWG